jgi:hypothetical protein
MTPDKVTPVPDEEDVDQVSEETLEGESVADSATTGKPSTEDAEALKAEQNKLKIENENLKRDVNNVKSTLQRQLAQREAEFKAKQAELTEELNAVRMRGMDEEEKKKFESRIISEKIAEAEKEKAETAVLKQQYNQMLLGMNYFLSQGVPMDMLVTDGGYDALYQSGMSWITSELKRLKQDSPLTKKTRKEAPQTVVKNTSAVNSGRRWEELLQIYGSEEKIYQLVQDRILPPSIIPSSKPE